MKQKPSLSHTVIVCGPILLVLFAAQFARAQSADWKVLHTLFLVSYDMQFTSDDTGYCAGFRAVLKTSDGGGTFETLSLPIDTAHSTFLTMSWPTSRVGYIGGQLDSSNQGLTPRSVILRTTDAGATWIRLPIDSAFKINKIIFSNPAEGYYLANAGMAGSGLPVRIAKSTDSGNTWRTLVYETQRQIPIMNFRNASEGFYARQGDDDPAYMHLHFTSDGLATSIIRDDSLYPIGDVSSIVPVDDGAWLAASDGNYFRTTNLGIAWTKIGIPGENYSQIVNADDNLVLEATEELGVDSLHLSTDFGQTWSHTTSMPDTLFIQVVAMHSQNTAYMLTRNDDFDIQWELMKWTNPNHLSVASSPRTNEALSETYTADGSVTLHFRPAREEEIVLYDMLGKARAKLAVDVGSSEARYSGRRLPAGAYVAELNGARAKLILGMR